MLFKSFIIFRIETKMIYVHLQELNEYVQNGTLKLRAAFSRDQAEKIYVTNLLKEDTDSLWDVIDNKGHVYICG